MSNQFELLFSEVDSVTTGYTLTYEDLQIAIYRVQGLPCPEELIKKRDEKQALMKVRRDLERFKDVYEPVPDKNFV